MTYVGERSIIVIGGSAGGIAAVDIVLGGIPAHIQAALFIVLHREPFPERPDRLTRIINFKTELTTRSAVDKGQFEFGHAYIAPADHHLLLENGLMRVERSPKENRYRPSVDVLFKSAASTYGRRVIGVLLSGMCGSDGTAGLWQIKKRGGVTIVQEPADAKFGEMPQSAIDDAPVDYVLPAARIGPKLIELTSSGSSRSDLDSLSPRILIVEDESIVAANLQQSLAEMGYDPIDWVTTGEAAIEHAGRSHPDLILMDIHLAGKLTGVEAARRIWQTLQIPVVYCTALADLETLKTVQTTESYGYVVKPFHSRGVRAAVELALARREKELRHPKDA